MKVSRSRKKLPRVAPKASQKLALENAVAEPVTPVKTSETLNLSTNSASPSLCSSGDGSIMVSERGSVSRVSARLAKKAGISEYLENADVLSAKRKKVEGALDTKLGTACSVGVPDSTIIQQDVGEGGVTELVEDMEIFKSGGSLTKLGFGNDVETSMVDTVGSNRRLNKEVKGLGLESLADDEVEKGFLSLRSGKRVGKKRMRDGGGLAWSNLFEGIENSKESGRVLNGDDLSESMVKTYVEEDVNGHEKEEKTYVNLKEAVNDKGGIAIESGVKTRLSIEEKGAVKEGGMVIESGVKTRLSIEEKGKMKQGVDASSLSLGDLDEEVIALIKCENLKEVVEDEDVLSAKRKKVEGALDTKLGSACSVGVPDSTIIQQDVGEGGVTELVEDMEIFKSGGSLAKLGFGNDVETSMVDTVGSNRRFNKEVKGFGLESLADDEVEKGFLSLRSGKRVGKKRMRDGGGLAWSNLFEGIENSKESGRVLNGDDLSESMVKTYVEEDVNGHEKEEKTYVNLKEAVNDKGGIAIESGVKTRLNIEEKGAVKEGGMVIESGVKTRLSIEEKGKMKQGVDASSLSLGDLDEEVIALIKCENLKEVVEDEDDIAIETRVWTRRRRNLEDKGKKKLDVGASSSSATGTAEIKVENVNESSSSNDSIDEALPDRVQARDANVNVDNARIAYRERFRRFARRNASRFAHFSLHDELGSHANNAVDNQIPLPKPDSGIEDWPGPFSTAMKIIKDFENNRNEKRHSASTDKSEAVELKWIPKNQESCKKLKRVPSLIELCLSVISKNADAITSLDYIPDALRHKICWFLCDSRRMDGHFLELLLHGTPTEIRLRDCSWLSEELFTKTFKVCDASKLTVFQFDLCGSCMPDCALESALAHSQNSLPALTTISLKGAYRLSDEGLRMLSSAAPSLKSVNISECSLLASEGVCCLASSLRFGLRELYLDYCYGIDAMVILPALQKLENLEVLSVAGIQTVRDDFVCKFLSANGRRMKELVLADCIELTDTSLKVIGDTCSDLRAINLTNLHKLTDISIGFLANGCSEIQALKLCRNAFSDEAIAAYLDVRGASLKDLALNRITQVSKHTALSLATNCRNLRSLDLSWCRNLSNEALGLIVDSCVLLEVLKLFGCTQVTNVLIDGHSNPQVKIVGLKMSPVVTDIDTPDFLVGPLRYP